MCFITPDNSVVAYKSGTDHLMWSHEASSDNSICAFVGNQRLLVLTKQDMVFPIQLLNTDKGSVIGKTIPQTDKKSLNNSDSDPRIGLFVVNLGFGSPGQLLLVQVTGDKINSHTIECRQLFGGPKIGTDGKVYVIRGGLHRTEDDQKLSKFVGSDMRHCIHFASKLEEPHGYSIYCGGGFGDRSGPSSLHIVDPDSRTDSRIAWGIEPVSEIYSAGNDRLLIASRGHGNPAMGVSYPAKLSLFSVTDGEKEWNITIDDLQPYQKVILATMPEEGLALIQTGKLLKLITIGNCNIIAALPKKENEFAIAKWLPSKRYLYIARTPGRREPGIMECYRIESE